MGSNPVASMRNFFREIPHGGLEKLQVFIDVSKT
jgi:hypothetical protein